MRVIPTVINRVRFAIIVCMLEAIDRWENEGGAAPLIYPPQPLISECGDAQAATACHVASDRPSPAELRADRPRAPGTGHTWAKRAESNTAPPIRGVADDGVNR